MNTNNNANVVINIENLTKVYKKFLSKTKIAAVNNLDLKVYDGEIFGLLGPNGSGKTTTLKTVIGLLKPTSGKITVLGYPPESNELKKQIGFMPEESYLPRYFTAKEALDFYAQIFNMKSEERMKKIDYLLDLVDLKYAQNRRIKEFSKGMMRRLTFAQAIINSPKVVFLDEPTSGLDPLGARHIKNLIRKFKEEGKTVFMTSHLLSDIEDVCDRIAIMFNGTLLKIGRIDELLMIKDLLQIVLKTPQDFDIDKVKSLLEKNNLKPISITNPIERLEDFFVRTIPQDKTK